MTVENYLGPQFGSGFVAAADAACGPKPIWINEAGFATTPGRSDDAQAQWWLRAAATWLAERRIEHLGIYEIKDLPPDEAAIGDTANYHLGITRANRERKLAFRTLARIISMFGQQPVTVADDRLSVSATPSDADVYRHAFVRQDGTQLVFLWTRRADAVVTARLPMAATVATEYALDGTALGRTDVTSGSLRDIALRPGQVRYFEIFP